MSVIKEVIVVEGKDDTINIKKALDVDTIETNGSAVSKETLTQIKTIAKKRGVIIFTDPDFNGERIRKIVSQAVPTAKHAFITRKEGVPKNTNGSLGVEHASKEVIKASLENIYTSTIDNQQVISQVDLVNAQLIGHKNSRKNRELLGMELKIGYVNGKQLLKRLQMFQVTKADFEQAVLRIKKGEI